MADYIAAARTNVFRVRDAKTFIDAVGKVAPDVVVEVRDWQHANKTPTHNELPGDAVMMYSESCHGDWPNYGVDEINNDFEIDWPALVSEHMVDDQVCVIMEAGSEKLRYISGWATAIYSDGRSVSISLTDIYAKTAAEFGVDENNITGCSY